ncbi:hypothetical protein B0H14DRAFT_2658876 [Mycena olivaceomarginata]|nr:hypothetical protein B0H14DRAFT_2658876 [Mycena olivaceomarginata]
MVTGCKRRADDAAIAERRVWPLMAQMMLAVYAEDDCDDDERQAAYINYPSVLYCELISLILTQFSVAAPFSLKASAVGLLCTQSLPSFSIQSMELPEPLKKTQTLQALYPIITIEPVCDSSNLPELFIYTITCIQQACTPSHLVRLREELGEEHSQDDPVQQQKVLDALELVLMQWDEMCPRAVPGEKALIKPWMDPTTH